MDADGSVPQASLWLCRAAHPCPCGLLNGVIACFLYLFTSCISSWIASHLASNFSPILLPYYCYYTTLARKCQACRPSFRDMMIIMVMSTFAPLPQLSFIYVSLAHVTPCNPIHIPTLNLRCSLSHFHPHYLLTHLAHLFALCDTSSSEPDNGIQQLLPKLRPDILQQEDSVERLGPLARPGHHLNRILPPLRAMLVSHSSCAHHSSTL
jgi:hypothetical protein